MALFYFPRFGVYFDFRFVLDDFVFSVRVVAAVRVRFECVSFRS